jgi:hypothetical protein
VSLTFQVIETVNESRAPRSEEDRHAGHTSSTPYEGK